MENKQSECNNFVPQQKIPFLGKDSPHKIEDHKDLQSHWQEEVRKKWEKYVPKITKQSQSSLVVVCPNDQWVVKGTFAIRHFLYAPRKSEQIESIDLQWQDKRLKEFMHQLWDNEVVTALVLASGDKVPIFEEYHELHSYCMMNSRTRENIKSDRQGIITRLKETKLISLNGLKNVDNDGLNKAYLIHLQLDCDFSPNVAEAPLEDSNFFVWLSFTKSGDIAESILITNCYVWNTFMDVAWKHDRHLSAEYNRNIKRIDDYYNSEHKIVLKSHERVSFVTPNQLIEMDTLWQDFIRAKYQVQSELVSVSMHRAVGILVANRHYQRFWRKYFPVNKFGFEKLYIHYYDQWKSFNKRYEDSKQQYLPLFVWINVSCNINLFHNMENQSVQHIEDCFGQLSGPSTHFWLPDCLNYSKVKNNINAQIVQYMKDLQTDFKLEAVSQFKHIYFFYQAIAQCLSPYLVNKWCLSFYCAGECANISRMYINKFKPRLCFGNGFELLLVYQKRNYPLVFVDEFVCHCHSSCTAIQLHSRSDLKLIKKGIRIQGWNESTVVALFRVIPVVHSQHGLLMYDNKSGKLCQSNNECGWKPSAFNK